MSYIFYYHIYVMLLSYYFFRSNHFFAYIFGYFSTEKITVMKATLLRIMQQNTSFCELARILFT